ncbi:TonB-dependent siderophore receptor [Paraburkholderia metrosideri]|uniref:Ferrichrome outer membrane transporter/phage receptor n=1 Tax=Paraburkholderia metrosideri TaxID=580937 RepID=A0ABM8NU27_9BURK|nr:TonB-dependent siderophore receptor [Paraburkholderia metrosideri]CAD6543482.1 Ferrichrome outer membrane transporter/phage receptor [Paraburkholderia metrosideri]
MEWATSTRVRAISAAAGMAFYAAATSHVYAQAEQSPPSAQSPGPAQSPPSSAKQTGSATTQPTASANTLPAIAVSGNTDKDATVGLVARRSVTGTKTDTPINETPQTINVVTAQQIEMTRATDINQALRYVPGFSTYSSDNRSDWYAALRGFTPTLFVDGLSVPNTINLASWRVDPYMIESLSVLRGPTSVLYGQGDPGAIVDVQSKLANGERIREVEVQVGNYARKQIAFDIGDKIGDDGRLSYRVLGVARDGNVEVGPKADQRVALSPSIKWQPSAATSFTLYATYLQDWTDTASNFLPVYGTVLPNPNGKIPADLYVGDPGFDKYGKKQASVGYKFEHQFNDIWTVRQSARFMHLSTDDWSVYGGGLDDADPTMASLTRYAGIFRYNYNRFDVDNQAQANFRTGELEHTVLVGMEYNRQTTTDSESLALAPDLNLFNPVYTPVTPAIFSTDAAYPRTDIKSSMDAFGVYLQDQIKWRRWVFTAGGRQDWSVTTQNDLVGGTQQTQSDHAFSGRVGVTYLGDYGLSPYISYSTSFNPLLGVNLASGEIAAPTRGRQIEAGLRWQPPGKNLMLNAAIYQINQTNVATPNLADPTLSTYVQTGEVRSRGIELSAVGKVTNNLSIIAAYVYQDVKNVVANDDSLNKWPVDIPRPRQMASLWADWTWHTGVLAGLGFGAGVRYQSSAAGASDNSISVPSYTLYDAAVHYDTRDWRFAVNASNIFNRTYVGGCQSASVCIYGNPRTVIASARYNW